MQLKFVFSGLDIKEMTTMKRTFCGLLLICFLLIQAGCAGWQASATRSEQYSAAVPTEELIVEGRNGSIEIQAGDFGEVFVDAQLKAYGVSEGAAEAMLDEIVVRVEESGGTLRVFADYPSGFRGSVGFVVKTPPDVSVDLKTGNGRVTVDGVLRAVKAKTSNGRVDLKNVVGPVDVKTSNGSVDIEVVEPASVIAETSNGKITFSGMLVGNDNRLETSNGSVDVRLAGEPIEVTYKTSNGTTTFNGEKGGKSGSRVFGDGAEAGSSQLNIKTSNGSISVKSQDDEIEP